MGGTLPYLTWCWKASAASALAVLLNKRQVVLQLRSRNVTDIELFGANLLKNLIKSIMVGFLHEILSGCEREMRMLGEKCDAFLMLLF